MDEKSRTVKQECTQAVIEFKEQAQQRYQEVSERIQQIREVVESERKVRDETSEFLIRSFGEEILKLQEMLNAEKNGRTRPNREAFELIEEINGMMTEQLAEERRER